MTDTSKPSPFEGLYSDTKFDIESKPFSISPFPEEEEPKEHVSIHDLDPTTVKEEDVTPEQAEEAALELDRMLENLGDQFSKYNEVVQLLQCPEEDRVQRRKKKREWKEKEKKWRMENFRRKKRGMPPLPPLNPTNLSNDAWERLQKQTKVDPYEYLKKPKLPNV